MCLTVYLARDTTVSLDSSARDINENFTVQVRDSSSISDTNIADVEVRVSSANNSDVSMMSISHDDIAEGDVCSRDDFSGVQHDGNISMTSIVFDADCANNVCDDNGNPTSVNNYSVNNSNNNINNNIVDNSSTINAYQLKIAKLTEALRVQKIKTSAVTCKYKKKCKEVKRLKKSLLLTSNSSLSAIQNIFIQMQFENTGKNPQARRFSTPQKLLSLIIDERSPTAYKLLSDLFVLPSPGKKFSTG